MPRKIGIFGWKNFCPEHGQETVTEQKGQGKGTKRPKRPRKGTKKAKEKDEKGQEKRTKRPR